MTLQDEIATRIAAWVPKGLPAGLAPAWVLFVRATVAAAGPRDHPEARNGLRWCANLVRAADATGMPLSAETLFSPVAVDAYLSTLNLPKGTRDAMGSALRRQHPSLGYAATTRVAKATADVPAVHLVAPAPTVLQPEVAETIVRFVPTLLPAELWASIGGAVRWIVRDATPGSPGRATSWCRDVAYLAAWLHAQHRVVSGATVLKAATIEEFLGVLLKHGRPPRSVASFAANLHAVREAHGLPCDVTRRTFKKATAKEPYNTAEIDWLYEQARRVPSQGRRWCVTAALDLMFGAGAKPVEVAGALFLEVSETKSGVFVVLSGRRVPVLPAYAPGILRATAQARASGSPFLIGGGLVNRPHRLSQLLQGSSSRWTVDADPTRARATWLVETAARPGQFGGLAELLSIARLTTMQRFDELLADIAARQLELSDTSFLTVVPDVAVQDVAAS